MPYLDVLVQNRMSAEFVSEVEGVLGEHEGDLELNQQKSPRPGEEGPRFPAQGLLDILNEGIQVTSIQAVSQNDSLHP